MNGKRPGYFIRVLAHFSIYTHTMFLTTSGCVHTYDSHALLSEINAHALSHLTSLRLIDPKGINSKESMYVAITPILSCNVTGQGFTLLFINNYI